MTNTRFSAYEFSYSRIAVVSVATGKGPPQNGSEKKQEKYPIFYLISLQLLHYLLLIYTSKTGNLNTIL